MGIATRGVMLMLLATAEPCLVYAQIYSCKDNAGRTLTSDRAIPECASRDMREIGKSGVVKRVIPAPLTAEQRRAKQLDEERHQQQADAALEARRRDQAVLARFRNEGEIDSARQRALTDLQEKIRQSDRVMGLASTQLANAEAEVARRDNKTAMPQYLQQRIDEVKANMANENKRRQQYQTDLSQVDKSFDDTLKRFRELISASATSATK